MPGARPRALLRHRDHLLPLSLDLSLVESTQITEPHRHFLTVSDRNLMSFRRTVDDAW
jgi:hypothetical protein